MRDFESRFVLILLLGLITACGESTEPIEPASPKQSNTPPTSLQSDRSVSGSISGPVSSPAYGPDSMPYGLSVDISFKGDVSQFSSQAKIVVFMRKTNNSMPLAVEQFAVSELPKHISFASDTQQSDIELVTRLSPSGKIRKSADDIEVISVVGMLEHPPKILTINLEAGGAESNKKSVTANASANFKLQVRVAVNPTTEIPRDASMRVTVKGDDKPWPIAIKSIQVNELLPILTFTDLDAMSFKQTLSSSKKLTISAQLYQRETGKSYESECINEPIEVQTANIPELVNLQFDFTCAPTG